MWTYERPRVRLSDPRRGARRLRLTAALATLGVVAGLAAAALAAGPHLRPFSLPRCYWIAPPLTHYQPLLLHSGFLDCALEQCRATLRPTADAGWVCFFSRPWG